MLRYRIVGLIIWFICSYDLFAGFRCFRCFFWSKLGPSSRLESTLNRRSEMFCIFLQRVTVLIGEPMEFTETVEEYRKAKKNAVS